MVCYNNFQFKFNLLFTMEKREAKHNIFYRIAEYIYIQTPLPAAMKSNIRYFIYTHFRFIFSRILGIDYNKAGSASASDIKDAGASVTGGDHDIPGATGVRLIAFYLPQYHPIPENDLWWGKGFTEWTNVVKARPNFKGHYQPRVPADLGYYDLRQPEVRRKQADLARRYGISGFCYYYYWFTGKRLLNLPLDEVLASGEPDFPFCICWANENWTRRWDGMDSEILIAQEYSAGDDRNFIRSLIPFFKDRRYIRINNRPLLLVYKVGLFPDPVGTTNLWRKECRDAGVGDIYLAAVQGNEFFDNPWIYGFDAAVEFPPHRFNSGAGPQRIINKKFSGTIFDYPATAQCFAGREAPDFRLFRTVMPGWDNTARRQDAGNIFINSTPEMYGKWLKQMIEWTMLHAEGEERIVFINAWNEWGEGNYLEPDKKYHHGYLEATLKALRDVELR